MMPRRQQQVSTPEPVAPEPVAPEPVRVASATDPDVKAASKARVMDDQTRKRGRQATRLFSGAQDTAYTRTTLG